MLYAKAESTTSSVEQVAKPCHLDVVNITRVPPCLFHSLMCLITQLATVASPFYLNSCRGMMVLLYSLCFSPQPLVARTCQRHRDGDARYDSHTRQACSHGMMRGHHVEAVRSFDDHVGRLVDEIGVRYSMRRGLVKHVDRTFRQIIKQCALDGPLILVC